MIRGNVNTHFAFFRRGNRYCENRENPLANQPPRQHDCSVQTIHAVFQNDGKWFIARCLDVPVTTQGRTLVAAQQNLREAVELYLETWGLPKRSKAAREVYLTSMEIAA